VAIRHRRRWLRCHRLLRRLRQRKPAPTDRWSRLRHRARLRRRRHRLRRRRRRL